MQGEKNLALLLKTMQPQLNEGAFIFSTACNLNTINATDMLMVFKEPEGFTIITTKEKADELQLPYSYIASWITLTVHSSLEAVGLTAAFSTALANEGISCNVVAAFYHDHIFVDIKDAVNAMNILKRFSETA